VIVKHFTEEIALVMETRTISRQRQQRKQQGRRQRVSGAINPASASNFRSPVAVSFPKTIYGFPDKLVTTLKYSQMINFTGSASPSAQVFNINSCFDPDSSGTGHQPSYFDKFSAVYARYFVSEACLDVTISNESATVPVNYAVVYSDQQIGANTVEELTEAQYSKYGIIGVLSSNPIKRVTLPPILMSKLMGTTPGDILEADDNMYAPVGSNPADQAWGIIRLGATDLTTAISCRARCVLTTRVAFKDLLTQSTS
jgi:hypothetical protein